MSVIKNIFVNTQLEEQIVDQYLSGDTACRVFASLEYFTYRSINHPVPGIFAKYNGTNNSGNTKNLPQLKRQLKTHILSFLASHQDMINTYGKYVYPNNFSEKDTKNFIKTCQKLVTDQDVKIYCDLLICIINKEYQKVVNHFYNTQKNQRKPEMDPNTQIRKFMPALGQSYQNEEKAAKLAREGKYVHQVDINEEAKKRILIQGSFLNCIHSITNFINGLLGKEDLVQQLEEFYKDFQELSKYFQYPKGYNDKNINILIDHWSKNKNVAFYSEIFKQILLKNYNFVDAALIL